jgi:kynurenine 3-monooxygenase
MSGSDRHRFVIVGGGRSINLAISHRGLAALEKVGLRREILDIAVPMRGRMIHSRFGELTFQPYGKDESHVLHSVSRGALNTALLAAAGRQPGVTLHFHRKCIGVDVERGAATFQHTQSGEEVRVEGRVIVSADGAFSAVRRAMQKLDRFDFSQSYLSHGYKELTIPPGPDGRHRMERNALHIWPRRSFMMIALPNLDGSFTCTLFWPFEGEGSFANHRDDTDVRNFFQREFGDAVPLMPTLVEDYFHNPTSSLVTVRCGPWHVEDRIVIVLDDCITRFKPDLKRAFETYYRLRKVHADTLADLAIGNFIEMRDKTASRWFLLKKKAEKLLHAALPGWYVPLYNMISHSRIPYAEAVVRAKRQNRTVAAVGGAIGLLLLLLLMVLV